MTMKIDLECRTCGHEQNHLLDLPPDPDDAQLAEAIEAQAHECDECGDMDWSPLPDSLEPVDAG